MPKTLLDGGPEYVGPGEMENWESDDEGLVKDYTDDEGDDGSDADDY